jgi:hypothetical protein
MGVHAPGSMMDTSTWILSLLLVARSNPRVMQSATDILMVVLYLAGRPCSSPLTVERYSKIPCRSGSRIRRTIRRPSTRGAARQGAQLSYGRPHYANLWRTLTPVLLDAAHSRGQPAPEHVSTASQQRGRTKTVRHTVPAPTQPRATDLCLRPLHQVLAISKSCGVQLLLPCTCMRALLAVPWKLNCRSGWG